jgi:hypothetical protein
MDRLGAPSSKLLAFFGVVCLAACGGREDLAGPGASDAAPDSPGPTDSGVAHAPDGGVTTGDSGHPVDAGPFDTGAPDTGEQQPDSSEGCGGGFHDCSGTCVDDTSPANCGSSCTPCSAPANGVAACNAGACSYTCETGYSVCSTGCCTCGDTQTDPNNCGYCGHVCTTGDTCTAGVCEATVVATDQANAFAIAADDSYVYWTTTGNTGAILKAPVAGGGATVLVSGSGDYPAGITIDSQWVYWSNEEPGGGVSAVLIAGGSPRTVMSGLDSPVALANYQGNLYVTLDPYMQTTGGGVVMSATTGGNPSTVASGQNQPTSIAAGAGGIFWTTATDLMTTGSGGATTFVPMTYPVAVAVDAQNVYWTSELDMGAVVQEPVGGGAQIELASGQYYPNAIAVDGTSVYWTSGQGGAGTVMKVAIGGGSPVALATGQAYPSGIALNSTTVFWVNFGDGTIMSVPK